MKQHRSSVLVALLSASVVLTACSAGDEPAGGRRGNASGPQGTLRFGVGFTLDNWDNLNKPNTTYISTVYQGLVEKAANGNTVQPRLASSWKQSQKEIAFTLRPGVVFHDGTPFDAEAVKANFARIRSEPSQYQAMLDPVSEVVAEDATHVRLKLKRPAPTLVAQLADRGGYMLSPKSIKDKSLKDKPAGTGPWTYNASATVRDSKVVLDYFDKYYAPKEVGAKRLEIYAIGDDESLFNALATGKVDVAALLPETRKRAESQGFKSLWYPALRYHFLFFDRKKTFADPKVRQAICQALDPKAILTGQFDGLGETYDQRFDAGQPGHDPQVKAYPHNPGQAKALLAGKRVSFSFPVFPGTELLGELVRTQLGEAGVEVKVEKMSTAQYFSTFDTGKYPAAYNTSTSEDSGPYDYYRYRFSAEGAGNPYKVGTPELDRLAEQGLNEPGGAKQNAVWQQMTKLIHDQALDCGFLSYPIVFAWDAKRVTNIVPTRFAPSAFRYREALPQR
ncbi:ABC transporter substrate-binding protein [Actinomadura sp. 9N215]|uniref:ABC transporter substrate-binding protein n=1 Tax=Actinomadura sp. 9N215 TaxID=3375150 RepID=UPI0037B77856